MKPTRTIAASFVVSIGASLALVVLYVMGGQPQLEGLLLGTALGGLGIGTVVWAKTLLYRPDETEEREPLPSAPGARDHAVEAEDVTRRALLVRLLAGAAAALGSALALPALSLGPRPGQSLFKTPWTSGARLVDADGKLFRPTDVGSGSVVTVFPEGQAGSADAQTLLLRVDPTRLRLPGGREDWVPEGCIAYSKICTHAGCPVGLYRAEAHELLCPCHQSTFDVLTGAEPTFGPADRPLPQLPLAVDEDGYLIAQGDFSEPVGPGFWNMRR